MGRYYKETTIKKLFALSGNICAFPECTRKIINENGEVFGEICHIEAASPSGPRYNSGQTKDERNGFDNLLLLCPNHHKDTDDLTVYTVPYLKEMKKNHESKYAKNPFNVSETQLEKIMKNIEDKLDRILEHVSKIPVLEQNSTALISKSDEILKAITEKKIENEFDLKSQSVDSVIAKIGMIGEKMNSEDSDYIVNANISKDKSTIEITHKNFEKIEKKGMIFNVVLKLKGGKSQSLHDLLKENKGDKVVIDANEIEEFSFLKEGKPMYVIKNPHDSTLTISKSAPMPVLVKLSVPGKPVELNYLLMEAEKHDTGKVTLSNLKQNDAPILVELEIDQEKNKGSIHLQVRENYKNAATAYEYNKLMNALIDSGQISFTDIRQNMEFARLKLHPDFSRTPDDSMELLRKVVEIQRATGLIIPWPPEQITGKEANVILDTYDIITKGERNGSISMDLKFQKGELASKKMIESIEKYGYAKHIAESTEPYKVNIFGTDIQLGKFTVTGKLTTEEAPHEFLKRVDNYADDDFISVKMGSLEGKAKIKYKDWPKPKFKV